jgi:alpha-ketoglutarate-dependent taurine dioxygenase
MSYVIHPLSPTAAEIIGLDCALSVEPSILEAIQKAFLEFPVLIFRDQNLSATELSAFSRHFGVLEEYGTPGQGSYNKPATASLREAGGRETPDQTLYLHPEDAGVLIMTNERLADLPVIGIVDNAELWHSDGSHKADPYKAIIVHVITNPVSGGGDTEFCDLRLAYKAMPPELIKELIGRTGLHHWSKYLNPQFAGKLDPAGVEDAKKMATTIPLMPQPLVRTHPDTGQPSLYLSPRFTVQLQNVDWAKSDEILRQLFEFIEQPAFRYRHSWQEKDLMIWDNRCLNHRVLGYAANDIRRRHRVTIIGDKPFYRA